MADPNEIVFEASSDEGGDADAGEQDDICLGNVNHEGGQQQRQQQVRRFLSLSTKRSRAPPSAAYPRAPLPLPFAPAQMPAV